MVGFSCLALGGREVGMALATLGLCVRGGQGTLAPPKDACLRGQSAVCPQTKSSPLNSLPGWVIRRGQLQKRAQEAVVITLADCERRIDEAFDFGI